MYNPPIMIEQIERQVRREIKHIKKELVVSTLTGVGLKATQKIGHLSAKS